MNHNLPLKHNIERGKNPDVFLLVKKKMTPLVRKCSLKKNKTYG